jgi:hypothetical protein
MRLHVMAEAGDEQYSWLNQAVIIAGSGRVRDMVIYDAYQVLYNRAPPSLIFTIFHVTISNLCACHVIRCEIPFIIYVQDSERLMVKAIYQL